MRTKKYIFYIRQTLSRTVMQCEQEKTASVPVEKRYTDMPKKADSAIEAEEGKVTLIF